MAEQNGDHVADPPKDDKKRTALNKVKAYLNLSKKRPQKNNVGSCTLFVTACDVLIDHNSKIKKKSLLLPYECIASGCKFDHHLSIESIVKKFIAR